MFISALLLLYTLRPKQNDHHFTGDILEFIILYENYCIVIEIPLHFDLKWRTTVSQLFNVNEYPLPISPDVQNNFLVRDLLLNHCTLYTKLNE